jgi:hypothetical protein
VEDQDENRNPEVEKVYMLSKNDILTLVSKALENFDFETFYELSKKGDGSLTSKARRKINLKKFGEDIASLAPKAIR